MRAQLIRHLDLVIVIWALALGVVWTMVAISRTETGDTQWFHANQAGPAWVIGS
jgi:hypothetical protein